MENKPLIILVVEDNPGDVRLIEEMLTELDGGRFHLESADRLSKGLARLEDGNYDIILLDLGLPDSRGIATLTAMLSHAPNIPVVVLTGLDDEMTGKEAISKGAQDYLVKGQVERNLLVRSIHYAIERKKTLEEREKLIRQLEGALAKVKALSGMLPICASCKKIRDDKGYWNQVEVYIRDHADVEFSHGYCPDCAKKALEEIEKFKENYRKG